MINMTEIKIKPAQVIGTIFIIIGLVFAVI